MCSKEVSACVTNEANEYDGSSYFQDVPFISRCSYFSTMVINDEDLETIFSNPNFSHICTLFRDYRLFDSRITQYINSDFIDYLRERILAEDFDACHIVASISKIEPDFISRFFDIFEKINTSFKVYILGSIDSIPPALLKYIIDCAFPMDGVPDTSEKEMIICIQVLIRENRKLDSKILSIVVSRILNAFNDIERGIYSKEYTEKLTFLVSQFRVLFDSCLENHLLNIYEMSCTEETTCSILLTCVIQNYPELALHLITQTNFEEASYRHRLSMANAVVALIDPRDHMELLPLLANLVLDMARSERSMCACCLQYLLTIISIGVKLSDCGISNEELGEACEEIIEEFGDNEAIENLVEILQSWNE